MTDWVSAREARRQLAPFTNSPEQDLIALGIRGVETRALGWYRDDELIRKNISLDVRFWESVQASPAIAIWDSGTFIYSARSSEYAVGRPDPECPFGSDERLWWKATGVEFYWDHVVKELNLKISPVASPASDEVVRAWIADERHRSLSFNYLPTEKVIRQRFKRAFEVSNLSISEGQIRMVQAAYPGLQPRSVGKQPSGSVQAIKP